MPPLRVAITGVAGRLGAAISKALKKDARVEVVAGLDVVAGKEVTQTADLAAGGFRLPGCDVVVHAAALPGPRGRRHQASTRRWARDSKVRTSLASRTRLPSISS